jgi:hypothetical protein
VSDTPSTGSHLDGESFDGEHLDLYSGEDGPSGAGSPDWWRSAVF